ncbi:uncharacterized protein LOC107410570 [Ziziphus jujuba]|uniref:Uncharacterized protein LOC107410570 n=2 Tax=Ziziphus jujuba TaxID=326968 RepID=A0A6P3Z8S3_ZIZJJ|nr:uncharacterized protein LOC107410570 [Ziziphus jujuba]KAH7542095.1 hypothetical protein FEM48_Zijuj02G0036900 [Ziziphus jujuba var. spinosa]
MASSSKSKPIAYHSEEEAAKKSAKKQFPSHTRYVAFVVLAIVVVMSVAVGIIWAVVKPRRPYVVVENGYIIKGTRNISDDNTTLSGLFSFECRFYNRNKKATIYFDTLNASSRFSDKTEELESLDNGFTLEPDYSMPINFKFRAEFWSIYGFMPNYQKQGRIVLVILFNAKIRFGFASWKSLPRSINIDCSNLVVFTGQTFKPTVCKVDY